MNITPRGQALRDLKPMEAAHFTGKAGSRPLLPASPALSTTAAVVRFEAGVRNYWHSHAGGQLLHVIEGVSRNGPFAHIVVNIGETRWLEESPPPPD